MNKIIVAMLSLSLALMLTPIAITNPDISTYDPMSDVNRDGIVDANDLSRLGKAYGSTQSVPTQSNQTVVYVYQLETDPSEVENAQVAIIDHNNDYQAVQIRYTNSSGLANFALDSNSNYTAIAWSTTTYNYANFTTNEYNEASVAIQLGYPNLPLNWVAMTFLNKTSGGLVCWSLVRFMIYEISLNTSLPVGWEVVAEVGATTLEDFKGTLIIGLWCLSQPPDPSKDYGVMVIHQDGNILADPVYTPDENGNANLVIYID